MSEFESGHMVGEGAEMMQALGQRGTVTSELLGWEPISKVGGGAEMRQGTSPVPL